MKNGPHADAAWAKLVARTQNLEEALASERASRRLLAARSAQEKVELLAKLNKATEEHHSMEQLWQDSKRQLARRLGEWEVERSALYQELARLRVALKSAGLEVPTSPPPSFPPANLAAALRDDGTEEAPTGGEPGGSGTGELLAVASEMAANEVAAPPSEAQPAFTRIGTVELAHRAVDVGSISSAELAARVVALASGGPSKAEGSAGDSHATASKKTLSGGGGMFSRGLETVPPPAAAMRAGRRASISR
jgi:hypothetical protein